MKAFSHDAYFFSYIYGMKMAKEGSREVIKTIIDYVVTIICLAVLSPVIVLLIIAIRVTGNGPVFYSQERAGKNGRPFRLLKFRSMYPGLEEEFPLLSSRNDRRVTCVGRFMRKYKLDEIPNFINVLKGEMSIIGPRPEQPYFINQITEKNPDYRLLHSVKPGITSWGQVKYGYASDIEQMTERLEYDLYYLRNRNLLFDSRIALCTIGVILKGNGI